MERAATEEIAALSLEGPTDRPNWIAVIAQAEAQFVYRLQTVGGFGGKSDQLNAYNVFLGEPEFFARDLERYLAATPASLAAAASRYLAQAPRVAVRASFRAVRVRLGARRIRCRPPFTDVTDRTPPPGARAEDVAVHIPGESQAFVAERPLRSGRSQHRDIPVQTMVLLVRVGSSEDPGDRPGLASLTGDMLDEGAGDYGALELNEALAHLGAQFDTEVGPDATFLTLTTLSRFSQRAFELMSDIIARPRFSAHEFDRVRQLRANRLRQLRDVPSAVADRTFASALYGSHPYGHLAIGTMDALEAMTLAEVVAFHQREFRPSRAVLVVVGDASHEEIVNEAGAAFSAWTDRRGANPSPARRTVCGSRLATRSRVWCWSIGPVRRNRSCESGISASRGARRTITPCCC